MLESVVKRIISENQSVLLSYSGGKDSTYVLKFLTERKIPVTAYMIDNAFLSETALENAIRVCKGLNVRLVLDVLEALNMATYFRKAIDGRYFNDAQIRRASDVCNVCMHFINKHVIRFALDHDIHYISGGYLEGQVPGKGCLSKIPLKLYMESAKKFEEDFLGKQLPGFSEKRGYIYSLSPLLELMVSEETILKEITEIGWIKPDNTGLNSSNCLINDFAIKKHIEKYGINPYKLEIDNQLKNGTISISEANRRLEYDYSKVDDVL